MNLPSDAPEDKPDVLPPNAHHSPGVAVPGTIREQRVVLVVDLVESVRLMTNHEAQTVARWCEFVAWVRADLHRRCAGECVKSLGDGLLLVFETPHTAWQVARAMHERLLQTQWAVAPEQRLWLRMGLHQDWLYRHALDVFGTAPNLAARLCSLAGPGETVCSASVWDDLRELADTAADDLGRCWLKHLAQPVHAFRLRPQSMLLVQSPSPRLPVSDGQVLQPVLALTVSTWDLAPDDACRPWADWVLHRLAARMARVRELRVIDPLSCGPLGLGCTDPRLAMQQFKADYLLILHGQLGKGRLSLTAELRAGSEATTVLDVACQYPVEDALHPDSAMLTHLSEQVVRCMLQRSGRESARLPLHHLDSHALMLAGIAGLHGTGRAPFVRAREVFEHLVQRHPRLSAPRVWLSHWHVLSITRGVHERCAAVVDEADMLVRQALWDQPDCDQAWAARAFVQCHLQHDPEQARASVLHALQLSPSQVMAWTYRTTIDSLLGDTNSAYQAGQQALRLAPFGPMRYYQCCLAGHAALFDGRTLEAAQLLETSCALNPAHSPTLRMLVVAHHDLGNLARARTVMAQLRLLEPDLTVERYLSRSPGAHAQRARFAQVMAAVGLPRS